MGVVQKPSGLFAKKCLLWQYDQLLRSPLDGVTAAPLESNIFEWHGNFYFKEDHEHFPGLVVHFVLLLPHDYPNSTPDMRLLTTFPHSHVFGDTICFSLLAAFQWYFEGLPNTTFWNPARTVRSLLESVYIFLTVDEDKHVSVTESKARCAKRNAQQARCSGCVHNPREGKIWPPEEEWMASTQDSNSEQQVCALAMHEDLVSQQPGQKKAKACTSKPVAKRSELSLPSRAVFVSLPKPEQKTPPVSPARTADFEARASALKDEALYMLTSAPSSATAPVMHRETLEDLRCSITGATFDHSANIVLGFGVNVERRSNGTINSITTDLEPISMEIFRKGKIRKSALGMDITHFFPFAINEAHWIKAKRVLPGCVDAILKDSRERNLSDSPEDRLLFVVGELWKSMAVLMMKGEAHASEKVLKGFCALHHILLLAAEERDPLLGLAGAFWEENDNVHAEESNVSEQSDVSEQKPPPKESESDWTVVVHTKQPKKKTTHTQQDGMLQIANSKVNSFVRHPRGRHKSRCPDFGRFLPLILLSDLSWHGAVQKPFIHELLARNARWIAQAHPQLQTVKQQEATMPSHRATQSWGPSATGLKLTAFQIRFALNVCSWAKCALAKPVFEAYEKLGNKRLLVRAMYDALGGRPSKEMMLRFQEEAKSIEAMTSYSEFFQFVDMPLGSMEIQKLLCDAMQYSAKCRYH